MNTMQMMISMVLAKDRPNDEKMLYALQGGLQPKLPALNMTSMIGVKKSIEKVEEKEGEIAAKKKEIEISQMRYMAFVDATALIISKISDADFKKAIKDAEADANIPDAHLKNLKEWIESLLKIRDETKKGNYAVQLPVQNLFPERLNMEVLQTLLRAR